MPGRPAISRVSSWLFAAASVTGTFLSLIPASSPRVSTGRRKHERSQEQPPPLFAYALPRLLHIVDSMVENPLRARIAANSTPTMIPVSYTHLRAHETRHDLVCRLLLEKKK